MDSVKCACLSGGGVGSYWGSKMVPRKLDFKDRYAKICTLQCQIHKIERWVARVGR